MWVCEDVVFGEDVGVKVYFVRGGCVYVRWLSGVCEAT